MSNVFVVGFKNVDEDSDSFLPLMVLSSKDMLGIFQDVLSDAFDKTLESFSFAGLVFEAKYEDLPSKDYFLGYEVHSQSETYPKWILGYEDMVYYSVPSY